MIENKRVLALVPARSGSKGLPNKNILKLCGKPLLAWSIEAALASVYVDEVIVSTDSEEIASIAREYGASTPFIRPSYLASDDAGSIDVILHAIDFLEQRENPYHYLVLLEPTIEIKIEKWKSFEIDDDVDFCVVETLMKRYGGM